MRKRLAEGLLVVLTVACPALPQGPKRKDALVRLSDSIRSLTRRVSPAVVEISVTAYATLDEETNRGVSQTSRQHTSGSGVIIDPSGYIVTNAHVVEGAVNVKVVLNGAASAEASEPERSGRTRTVDARIVGLDRDADVALIRVYAQNLPVLQFAGPDDLRQGDLVLAIGSPMGLHNSVSLGIVSATSRVVSNDNPILYIQTDASINPGNSGGALVDMSGSLVGLNTFIVSQSGGNEGIGFAIPGNVVQNVCEQLRRKGKVSRAAVGLLAQNITRPLAEGLSLPVDHGVVVADVQPDGPAERAGLKRRDVILSAVGKPIETVRQLQDMIFTTQAGNTMPLLVQRGETRLSVSINVVEQSAPWDPLAALVSPEKNLVPRLGILCIEIDKKLAEMLPDLRRQYGLIIAAKSPEGHGQWIDLQPGDVIHAVNNVPVASLAMFQTTIEQFQRGDAVALQIERDGHFQYVAFEID